MLGENQGQIRVWKLRGAKERVATVTAFVPVGFSSDDEPDRDVFF